MPLRSLLLSLSPSPAVTSCSPTCTACSGEGLLSVRGKMGKLPARSQPHSCVAYSKAQKQQDSPELAEHLQGLDLKERPGGVPLARIQRLFSFRALGSGSFPQPEKDSFQERLALIPSGMVSASAYASCLMHLVEGLSHELKILLSLPRLVLFVIAFPFF